jgi:hypothetical protein
MSPDFAEFEKARIELKFLITSNFKHMNKIQFLIVLVSSTIFAQNSNDYKVVQFKGNDSINGYVSKIVRFNDNGQVIYEETKDFMFSRLSGLVDNRDTFFYRDTLLIKKKTEYPQSENKNEITYKYNANNQLIKETHKSFEKRLKKRKIDDGCLIEDNDFKRASWKITSQLNYKYNSSGKVIESYSPKVHWNEQNRYLYEYDENGKTSKIRSLHNDEIIYTEIRFNNENGYDYCRIWHEDETNKDCIKKSQVKFKLNNHGKVIECSKPDETRIPGNITEKYFYNCDGSLYKKQRFDTNGKLEITHVYIKI